MKHSWSSQQFREGARAVGRQDELILAAEVAATAIKRAHPDLPVILTLHHLAHLVEVSADQLQQIAFRKEDAYRVFRVKKRGVPNTCPASPRNYRTICVPKKPLMRTQRWIAQNILNVIKPHPSSFAFTPKRDLVDAAERHLGAKWLIKMDVRHFFESITEHQVYWVFRLLGYGALLSFQMARICTRLPRHHQAASPTHNGKDVVGVPYRRHRQGHLPQGAPSSPMLANLTMRSLDRRLMSLAEENGWTYTRYADDLAFSRSDTSSRAVAMHFVKRVEYELKIAGLINHRQKTSIVPPGARKLLLGVLVDSDKPRLTREFRNNIETHLFALSHKKVGALAHQRTRGFASIIGMRRHIEGLIAFAHQVDPEYAAKLYKQLNAVDWSR